MNNNEKGYKRNINLKHHLYNNKNILNTTESDKFNTIYSVMENNNIRHNTRNNTINNTQHYINTTKLLSTTNNTINNTLATLSPTNTTTTNINDRIINPYHSNKIKMADMVNEMKNILNNSVENEKKVKKIKQISNIKFLVDKHSLIVLKELKKENVYTDKNINFINRNEFKVPDVIPDVKSHKNYIKKKTRFSFDNGNDNNPSENVKQLYSEPRTFIPSILQRNIPFHPMDNALPKGQNQSKDLSIVEKELLLLRKPNKNIIDKRYSTIDTSSPSKYGFNNNKYTGNVKCGEKYFNTLKVLENIKLPKPKGKKMKRISTIRNQDDILISNYAFVMEHTEHFKDLEDKKTKDKYLESKLFQYEKTLKKNLRPFVEYNTEVDDFVDANDEISLYKDIKAIDTSLSSTSRRFGKHNKRYFSTTFKFKNKYRDSYIYQKCLKPLKERAKSRAMSIIEEYNKY